uniref:Uncharacterized protein n=1 Tax=Kalanchoe fedtschenkoi TaxID=63787 RepID=A0A7N1A7F5_KALFE
MGVSNDKKFSLSMPTKPCPKLTSSVEAKENRLTSPDFANQKKCSSKKNFMSPTISAASKAVVHRKKVLAERLRGEATEPTCAKLLHRRSTSFDLKYQGSVAVYNSADSLSLRVEETNGVEDGEDGDKSKPYDPVFNYCSPRPKFLLYKPDRRSEILRRYEMVESTSSESETGSENEESSVKPNEEVPENAGDLADHDDDHGEAEEAAAKLKKDASEKVEERVEEDRERVEEHIEEAQPVHEAELVKLETESSQPEGVSPELKHETTETDHIEALETDDDDGKIDSIEIEEEEGECAEHVVERSWSLKRLLKLWFLIVVVGLSILYVSSMNSPSSVGLEDEYWMVHSGLHGAPFTHKNASGSVMMAEMGFEEASYRIMDQIIVGDHDDASAETSDEDHEVKYEGGQVESAGDQIEATEDGMDSEPTEVLFYAAGEILTEDAGDIVDMESVCVEEIAPEASLVVEPESEACEASYAEMDGLAGGTDHTEVTQEGTVFLELSSGEELEVEDREAVDFSQASTESGDDETLSNLEEAEVSEVGSTPDLVDELTPMYSKETDKVMIISVVSALLLLGGLGFLKLKRTTTSSMQEPAGVTRPDASRGQLQVKQVDPLEYPSLSQSFKSGAGAPRVELLAEFTVGENEVSSYRSRTNCIENGEDSTYSFSHRNVKMAAKQTRLIHGNSHPAAASGFSSTTDSPPYGTYYSSQRRSTGRELPASSIDSPSYGSFTTELMLRKKEEARGLDKVIVTPVRRSSRIRGRMTPGASQ